MLYGMERMLLLCGENGMKGLIEHYGKVGDYNYSGDGTR
jgi:hypothetical protein